MLKAEAASSLGKERIALHAERWLCLHFRRNMALVVEVKTRRINLRRQYLVYVATDGRLRFLVHEFVQLYDVSCHGLLFRVSRHVVVELEAR